MELVKNVKRLGWLPLGPAVHPSLCPAAPFCPSPLPVCMGPAPEPAQRTPCQGRTLSGKSRSKDLITLSTLHDPLGLSDVPPPEESVDVCSEAHPCRHQTARCALEPPPPSPCWKERTASWQPVPNSTQNVSLFLDKPRVWSKGQRKWFGIDSWSWHRRVQVPWTSRTPFHLSSV